MPKKFSDIGLGSMKKNFQKVCLIIALTLITCFPVMAQDYSNYLTADEMKLLSEFMNGFLRKRSHVAATIGNSIITENGKASDDYYWKPYLSTHNSVRDNYLIIDDNWSLEKSIVRLDFFQTANLGNAKEIVTQYFDITISFHAIKLNPSESIDVQEIENYYDVEYRVIKVNDQYRIEFDGYIRGYQYIFESDLETLLERRRATLALDEPIPPAPQEFKGTKGIVTGKNVAVRNVPSVKGTVVESVIQKQLVDIQEYAGSGNMMDGIWDYWARIGENRWVNASYVFETPFYFRKSNDVSSIFYEVSTIKDDNVNASSRAIDCVGYSTVSKEDMTLRAVNLDENNLYRGLYLISHIWKLQMKDSQLADAIAAVIDDKYYKGPDPSIPLRGVRYENGGISVDVLPYMENEIEGFTITTPEVPLFFGVRVGMTRDEVCSILGKPLMNMSDIVEYQYNKELRLRFLFTDGILTAVVFNHYL